MSTGRSHRNGLRVRCPKCGDISDIFTVSNDNLEDRGPGPGDLLICCECGGLNVLRDDMTARRFTDEDRASPEFAGDIEEIDKILAESKATQRKLSHGKRMS